MLLVLDVGNTNITLGIYNGDTLAAKPRLTTSHGASPDEYGSELSRLIREAGGSEDTLDAVVIASVVPGVRDALNEGIRRYLKKEPYWIDADSDTGIRIQAARRGQLGADRLVDAAAAYRFYSGPVMIIDFGTATTYDVVSESGEFLGGAIAPGVKISAEALWEKAEQLPKVALKLPGCILGKNTVESMQSGILFGYIGQVEYFVAKTKRLVGQDLNVVATGGLSALFKGNTDAIDIYDEDLTLKGLKYLFERNSSGSR